MTVLVNVTRLPPRTMPGGFLGQIGRRYLNSWGVGPSASSLYQPHLSLVPCSIAKEPSTAGRAPPTQDSDVGASMCDALIRNCPDGALASRSRAG